MYERHRLLASLVGLLALAPWGGSGRLVAEPQPALAYLRVDQEGLLRVPATALAEVGLDKHALEVTRHGIAVPMWPHQAGEDLLFLARSVAGAHTALATFQLQASSAPQVHVSVEVLDPVALRPGDVEVAVSRRAVDARDLVIGAQAAARHEVYAQPTPHWFVGGLAPGGQARFEWAHEVAQPAGPQRVEVRAVRTHEGEVALGLDWDGERTQGSAELRAATLEGALLRFDFDVPAEAWGRRPPAITLQDRSPPPPPAPARDVSSERGRVWIDSFHAEGLVHALVPARGLLELGSSHPLAVRGSVAAAHALVVDAAGALRRAYVLRGHSDAQRVWRVPPTGADERLLLCAAVDAPPLARPSLTTPPLVAAAQARHVIVSVPALLAGAQRLAQHRTQRGLPSAAIDVRAVYEAHGYGEAVPAAIRRFVEALQARPDVPLEHLLLAGDATYDRTDLRREWTLPAPMARTAWNGVTACDRLYAERQPGEPGGAHVGRLPFDTAEEMNAYVSRLMRYELQPPPNRRRRLLRFLTNEARFGALVDRWIETQFRRVLVEDIPPAYDVTVTFGSPASPYFWPAAEWNEHVIDGLNDGALFTVYVGHGYAQGFDTVREGGRQHRVLDVRDAPKVHSPDLPPVLFVLACSTAEFDTPERPCIGEALLRQSEGPVAFWGATRICHPSWNTLIGKEIAVGLGAATPPARLGPLVDSARDRVLRGEGDLGLRRMIGLGTPLLAPGPRFDDVLQEGARMYEILGDPALVLAVPRVDLDVTARWQGQDEVLVRVEGQLLDTQEVLVELEHARDRAPENVPLPDPADAERHASAVRERNRRANDRGIAQALRQAHTGAVEVRFVVRADVRGSELVVKAMTLASPDGSPDVRLGATRLAPAAPAAAPR